MNTKASLAFLGVAFAMLWIPVGQHTFLFAHWMKLGTFMAPFLLLMAFAFRQIEMGFDARFLSLILLVAYIVHQFEEHWIDLYGNTYAFKPYVNDLVLRRLGEDGAVIQPLSDAGVFVINTSLVWLVAGLAICLGPRQIFPTLCMAAIVFVNGISHVGTAALEGTYNPGLLTSVILFLPLGMGVYVKLLRDGVASRGLVMASLIWSVLGHVVMIVGLIASGWYLVIPELAYFAVLVAWSIIPAVSFRPRS